MQIEFPDCAYEPLFTEAVKVTATRSTFTRSIAVRACVMPLAMDAPLTEFSASSVRASFQVLIKRHGDGSWNASAMGGDPQIGDTVTLQNGKKARTASVKIECGGWYTLEVREC